MVSIEITDQDIRDLSAEVRNLPGALFGRSGPLFRPFLDKMEELLPPEKRGRGPNYVSSTLKVHVDTVQVDEKGLKVDSEGRSVEITKAELENVLGEKYPAFEHQNLNLPGLLFLQCGPVLQTCIILKLGRDHGIKIPGGVRTHRYFFHTTVASIQADQDRIVIELDLDRLPTPPDA